MILLKNIILLFFLIMLNFSWVNGQNSGELNEGQEVFEYYQVDELPKYKGSSDFESPLYKKLEWPEGFDGQGSVFLSFVVASNGDLRNLQVIRGLCEHCDKNAKTALSELREWRPAQRDSIEVATRMYVNIFFRLQ